MAQTLKFGNGTWATKKDSILAYNDQNENYKPLPFNYTGAGKGTRVNKEGLIEVVENDRPRIDYLDSEDGVFLLEKASTNLFTYSEDFANSYWNKNSASVTLTSEIAPNGTSNSVYNLVGTAANLWSAGTIGTQHTISFYIKSNGQGKDKFRLRLGNNTSIEYTATNEWVRYEYTETPTTSVYSITTSSAPNDEYDLLVWGAQSEQSSQSSSYIPTQGSIQTRVAETANGSGNSEVFNDSEGVLFVDYNPTFSEGSRQITLNDNSYDNRIIFECRENGTKLKTFISSELGSGMDIELVIPSINSYYKCAIKYKQNDGAFWINGFKVGESTVTSVPVGLNNISFSGRNDTSLIMTGKTKEIAYYDEVLTDLELETLTSYRNWESMVKELNLNVIYNG
jgi:hypothetical protein